MGLISRVSSRTYRKSLLNSRRLKDELCTSIRNLSRLGDQPTGDQRCTTRANRTRTSRQMSPHLSVYQWSVPMSISGAYRVTSVFPLSAVVLLTPLVYEAGLLTTGDWDPAQSIIAYSAESRANYNLDHVSLMMKKALLVSPLVFHMVNGCRHIRWDQWAIGIRHLEDVYKSGNIVLAVTLALSVIFTVAHW